MPPTRASASLSNVEMSSTPSGRMCRSMSTIAADKYSSVAMPWLNLLARSIFSTSDCGIGSPVW